MDQLKYRDLLKSIAGNHKQILNPPTNRRFLEVFQTADPFSREWDTDFISALRTRVDINSGNCIMVVESITTRWTDRGGQNRDLRPSGCFIILKKSTNATMDEVNKCIANTQQVAEEILAYIEEHSRRAWNSSNPFDSFYLYMGDCEMMPVKLFDNIYGTRVEFNFMTPKNKALVYNPAKWNVPL